LIIRAVVDADPGHRGAEAEERERERDAIIKACVEETLRILRKSRER